MRALLAYGTGRYSDPWHPLADTSAALAAVLRDAGFDVTVTDDLDGSLAQLDGVDLFVVNATDPWRNGETGTGASEAGIDGLRLAVERGIGVLAVHNAVATLRDYPLWRRLLGGTWVAGVSGHPPLGELDVTFTGGGGTFTLMDECYQNLDVDGDLDIAAVHVDGNVTHPLMWTSTYGRTRVAYDALGHDTRSYESAEHRQALVRLAQWAAQAPFAERGESASGLPLR